MRLRAAHDAVCLLSSEGSPDSTRIACADRARGQFEHYLDQIEAGLHRGEWGRVVWVLGTGYLSAWQLVHRAQEALIDIEPIGGVVLRARYDQRRLSGGHIANSTELSKSLDPVVKGGKQL